MLPYAHMRPRGPAETCAVIVAAFALTAALTYPLLFKLDRVGRTNTSDGLFSIWTVAWVAHALTTDPRNLYNANIFYPHTNTLAFSEANLVSGAIGAPVWTLTQNPYLTLNVATVLSFIASFAGMYYLARYLTRNRGAAATAAIMFTFCPFVFARTAHIQLLWIGGLPWCMLAFHRLADLATVGRAVVLGLALWGQALACAYYGIFAGLMVGFATLLLALTRGLWRDRSYWIGIGLAAFVSIGLTAPFFLPFLSVQTQGFGRTLEDARAYSADGGAWLASSAWAHRWWLPAIEPYNEVLFPGICATVLGLIGIWIGLRPRSSQASAQRPPRDIVYLYVALGLIAFWASFGPDFGLYTALHNTIPVFSFLRAPSRMGIITTLSLTVLSAVALASWPRLTMRAVPAAIVALIVVAELTPAPLTAMRDVEPLERAYRILSTLPRGPVAEFPYFYERPTWPRHSYYLVKSTSHWHPLVNGYSDHIPADFRRTVLALSSFPTRESFRILRNVGARYVVIHPSLYDARSRENLLQRLKQYEAYLRPIVREGENVWLFEIVAWPDER
jgi:hypothetical protein